MFREVTNMKIEIYDPALCCTSGLCGLDSKRAAGINAFAVTPPSFSSLIPHLKTANWDVNLMVPLLIAGAIGSFIGARITSLYVPSAKLKKLFGVLIVVVTLYKIYTLVR
jgi:uncharacterized membrane protein YfcA